MVHLASGAHMNLVDVGVKCVSSCAMRSKASAHAQVQFVAHENRSRAGFRFHFWVLCPTLFVTGHASITEVGQPSKTTGSV